MASYTAIANASLKKVWEHLILKIEHPENFVPGVSNVSILEKNDDYVIRQMNVLMQGNTITLKEKIMFQPYKVRFELLEHPVFEGYVDNEAKSVAENETEITYTIHWKDKLSNEWINNPEMVKSAVLKTIEFIEQTL